MHACPLAHLPISPPHNIVQCYRYCCCGTLLNLHLRDSPTMLPPADPAVLSANPKFNALYQDLCANKLNPDGTSTIHDAKVLKERESFAEVCC